MADVTFTAITQPAPACYPPDVNALLTLIATLGLRGTVPDNSGGGVFVGSTQPSSSLTQKVWFVVDAAGRPLGIKMFYNGNWRPVPFATYGDIKAAAVGIGGSFDGNGRGLINTWYDGWVLCDGRNGAPDLRDRFVIAAADPNSLVTNVDPRAPGQRVSGTVSNTLGPADIPPLWARIHFFQNAPTTGGNGATLDGSATAPNATDQRVVTNGDVPIQGGPHPVYHIPPFYSMVYTMWVGYP